jgi:hypothetical protein
VLVAFVGVQLPYCELHLNGFLRHSEEDIDKSYCRSKKLILNCEHISQISGSHGGEYEAGWLSGRRVPTFRWFLIALMMEVAGT